MTGGFHQARQGSERIGMAPDIERPGVGSSALERSDQGQTGKRRAAQRCSQHLLQGAVSAIYGQHPDIVGGQGCDRVFNPQPRSGLNIHNIGLPLAQRPQPGHTARLSASPGIAQNTDAHDRRTTPGPGLSPRAPIPARSGGADHASVGHTLAANAHYERRANTASTPPPPPNPSPVGRPGWPRTAG